MTNKAFLDLLREYDLKDKLKALFQDPQYRQLVASLEPKVPLNFRKALTGNVQAPVEPGRRQIRFTMLSFKKTTK